MSNGGGSLVRLSRSHTLTCRGLVDILVRPLAEGALVGGSMAEIGVVRFAQVAQEVAEAALPQYRSPFSSRTVTQPTLLASQCMMHFV